MLAHTFRGSHARSCWTLAARSLALTSPRLSLIWKGKKFGDEDDIHRWLDILFESKPKKLCAEGLHEKWNTVVEYGDC